VVYQPGHKWTANEGQAVADGGIAGNEQGEDEYTEEKGDSPRHQESEDPDAGSSPSPAVKFEKYRESMTCYHGCSGKKLNYKRCPQPAGQEDCRCSLGDIYRQDQDALCHPYCVDNIHRPHIPAPHLTNVYTLPEAPGYISSGKRADEISTDYGNRNIHSYQTYLTMQYFT